MEHTLDGISSELYKAIVTVVDDRVRDIKVTRQDFDELKGVVRELVEAQKRTEGRVEELVEAQKRTEIRVEELAEAQKRTEIRVVELAEAQKRTEIRVVELAEAQKQTETGLISLTKEVRTLTRSHKELQRQVGGISNTIGYGLEDKAFPILPDLLKRDFGIEVDKLYRRFLLYPDGKDDEINIYGEGKREGQKVYVIGEANAQLGRRDVNRFLRMLKRVQAFLPDELVPLLLTYAVHPRVEQYAVSNGLKIYWSHDL